jgi:hypothetical protein
MYNFTTIRPVGSGCSMRGDGRTDRRTDTTKQMVAFHNFENASKNPSTEQCSSDYIIRYGNLETSVALHDYGIG